MNAPYEIANAMARNIFGMKPAPIIQPNEQTVVHGSGYYPYQHISSNGLVIDCLLEYEPEHDGGTGPNSEESWPERIDLIYAMVNGVDICMEMCSDVKALIETEALQSIEMDGWNADYDLAEERAQGETV